MVVFIKTKNYAKLIHNDAKVILIVLIISIICEIWVFETTSNYDYLILMVLYLIVIFSNKNSKRKSLGIFTIIASLLIIVESVIEFKSLFNLIFVLLGIFSIYHSICYLKYLR